MSWFDKIKSGFKSVNDKISDALSNIVHKQVLDPKKLSELKKLLLEADLGIKATKKIIDQISKLKNIVPDMVQDQIKSFIANSFDASLSKELIFRDGLNVIVMCGVNGNGKTTTIGKLAYYYGLKKQKAVLGACDTFRAGATEQLEHWAKVNAIDIVKGEKLPCDPASVAYKAVEHAKNTKADLLIIDTAGRLHNNKNLMEELAKLKKVILKHCDEANVHFLMTIDATTGQNAVRQMEDFKKLIPEIQGFIVTKMDSSAKAGTIINIMDQFNIPVYFIGTGERIEDLETFSPAKFTDKLFE